MTFAIQLAGQRALVTGAGQGVGRGIALTLAAAGATVFVNDLAADRADATVEQIRAAGGAGTAAPFDVTNSDAVHAAVSRIGAMDILVNNAGNAGSESWNFTPFALSKSDEWARYFNVNLYGVMFCTHAVLPSMTDRGYGRIVTIISDAARWGERFMAPYAAAKAGAAGFMRSIAREAGPSGITVNSIALGSMAGPARENPAGTTDGDGPRDDRRALRQYIIRRRGQPDDVAPMVALLVSPMASWITGQTIPINGGYTVSL